MSIQRASSSFISSPSSCWRYDVFLSFRGEDTRTNFTDHLYAALKQKGINVFRDDNELERGKSISPELFKAIEESRYLVVVFSKTYANSTWCLDELVKIVECQNTRGKQIVFPIFYNVEPTVVRKQSGDFQEAFAKHEEAFRENIEKVKKWRNTLKEVANISGWELKKRGESKFIEDVVNEISKKLIPSKFESHKELVGLNARLEEFMLLLDRRSDDVRMIGICGMGGLGKTTIARVVYELIACEFEGSSFLADVRETCEKSSIISLQQQLLFDLLKVRDNNIWNVFSGIEMIGSRLRRKKVLLVIDDVVNIEQLESLAKRPDWFGLGSRIIITSREKHLLRTHGVYRVYMLDGLKDDEALQLFCMKAFHTHQPIKQYEQLSKLVLGYAAGLPLALKVLGSFLYGRTIEEWESSLERLKRDSANEILKVLQLSFDGLEDRDKKIFLDIACFFKGQDKDYVTKILGGCNFDPIIGMHVLIEKSLISIDDNILQMHDLIQQMGHQIVKRESKGLGTRSRLWKEADVRHVLSENKGTEEIEGMIVNYSKDETYSSANAKAFLTMTNLRLLKIHNVNLPEGLEYLPNELRLLDWHGYQLESLPSVFQLDKTVELSLCYSNIKQMLTTIKPLNNMKFMRFKHSKNLIRTPDFTGLPNLEELDLEGCTRLCEIHPSLLHHNKLIVLSLKDCTSLKTLPRTIAMESLTKLLLSGCSKLRKFPDITGSMECLSELFMDGSAIKELPLSAELLSGLVLLNLKDCKNLETLPSVIINSLKCLNTLNLSGCSRLKKFPEIVERMECLAELSLDGTGIEELPLSIELLSGLTHLILKHCDNLKRLPSTINGLNCLKTLNLCGCSKLENVPENLGKVESLEELDLSGTAIRQPVLSIFRLKNLKALSFRGCRRAPASASASWFSFFPISLMPRRSSDSLSLVLPSLLGLSSLTRLDLGECNLGEGVILNEISNLVSLVDLNLSGNNFVSLPETIHHLSKLGGFHLNDCKRLQSLPELPSSIQLLTVNGCTSLETLSTAKKLLNSYWLTYESMNCLKLLGSNDLAFSLLQWFLETEPIIGSRSFVIPGSKIPEWFIYRQNEGSSIRIKRPQDFYNNKGKKNFVGYVVCCVFHARKHPPTLVRKYGIFFTTNDFEYAHEIRWPLSDHLFVVFLPNESSCHWASTTTRDNFGSQLWHIRNRYNDFKSNDVEFSFYGSEGLEVKSCGVRPVYVQEVEEFKKTTMELATSKVCNINQFDDEVFVRSKRNLIEYAESDASVSDEEPQSKRFKEIE